MKIIELKAQNIKGLKAVEISPSGDLVEIAGKNGAGKSSVLDAIWLALGGGDAKKSVTKALRNGADEGYIDLDLGRLQVRRTYSASGTSKLAVKQRIEGIESSVSQAQTTLDALRAITLDPESFIRLDTARQRDALLGLLDLPLDLNDWKAERDAVYSHRREVGRRRDALGDVPAIDDDLPKIEQSAAALLAEIRKAEEHNRAVSMARYNLAMLADEIKKIEAEIARLSERLVRAQGDYSERSQALAKLGDRHDTTPLEAELATVEETNAQIRANNSARAKLEEKSDLVAQYNDLTLKLDRMDEAKERALAEANVPLPGLGISEDGITYQGVPLGDVNSADQIVVVLHIVAALNPRLRIVQIRNGSLLDDDTFAAVTRFAAEQDFQVWIEVVGDGHGDAIVIEAGEVSA